MKNNIKYLLSILSIFFCVVLIFILFFNWGRLFEGERREMPPSYKITAPLLEQAGRYRSDGEYKKSIEIYSKIIDLSRNEDRLTYMAALKSRSMAYCELEDWENVVKDTDEIINNMNERELKENKGIFVMREDFYKKIKK